MPGKRRLGLGLSVLCALATALPSALAAEGTGPALLARAVPANTRLYLEFRGFDSLTSTPFNLLIARMMDRLLSSTQPAGDSHPLESQPSTQPAGWRQWFARTVGLANPKAADLLFTGPVAFAAEGWSGIGDAILLAEPRDPKSFEEAMKSQKATESAGIRKYRLNHDHELACDGHTVVIGRVSRNINLYLQAATLLESEGGATLGEIAEFRERMSGLPRDAQIIFYAGSSARAAESQLFVGQWWPESWSGLRSLALGAAINTTGFTVDVNGRMDPDQKALATPPLAADALMRLPASVVVAWTQPIDFVDSTRRLMVSDAEGLLQSLFADMPGGSIEGQLLRHFVGSAVFVAAAAPMPVPPSQPSSSQAASPHVPPRPPAATTSAPTATASATSPATIPASAARPTTSSAAPATSTAPATAPAIAPLGPPPPTPARKAVTPEPGLVLPGLAMLVETDDPHAVEAALDRLTLNLQYLVATRSGGDFASIVRRHPEGAGGQIVSVSLGRLLAASTDCPFLATLEFSWIVWDRWLIVGTNTEVVRRLVSARRGEGPLLPSASLAQHATEVVREGATGQMLLVAQPRLLAGMLDSWVAYVTARHPEMLQPQWWQERQRQQRSMRVQLGVVPTARAVGAAVEVGQILPKYPADGVLEHGDLILGVNGRSLSADAPSTSLRQMLAAASESGQVSLRIRRSGRDQDVTVKMPRPEEGLQSVEPIKLVEQAARFLRPFPTAVYAVWRPAPDLLKAHLELRFTAAARPGG